VGIVASATIPTAVSVITVTVMTGSAPPGPVSPATMREVLGHFVSGIVVVTAIGNDGEPVGFTCQSFASLSLHPPLISFAPARTSTTWPRIRPVSAFCVNVLAEDHQELSAGFARSGVDKFAGVHWRAAPSGSPILDGVSAWIDCTLWNEYDGGDHTIVVGRVHDLGADPARLPLLYYRGRYGVTADGGRDG
jgi:3-hydroxy-9,10-secoandrosta-1,3,5(10)-triene-9,17-dione monooxygenase reductase component